MDQSITTKACIEYMQDNIKTPCYIVEEKLLRRNLEILKNIKDRTDCKILLAQKAFSMYKAYPMIAEYLDGTTASGLYEARLGYEEFGKETHVFSPAYTLDDYMELEKICDHFVFNSLTQWRTYQNRAIKAGKRCGLRINPEYSTGDHEIYNPCAKYSRFGITREHFMNDVKEADLVGITGLHFHTLCEQNSDDLVSTLQVVEEKFGTYLYQMEWLNFGGGHLITKDNYDRATLVNAINHIQTKYELQVYLEPGEAIGLDTGFLVSTVVDLIQNGMDIAIVDTSAACHMPDVLEMPYRPMIIGGGMPDEKKYTYRLGGATCLTGDIIGDYSFDHPLSIGDLLIFCDMAHYTMVKNNTFNGMKLPSIYFKNADGKLELVKEFGYEDFKQRLS